MYDLPFGGFGTFSIFRRRIHFWKGLYLVLRLVMADIAIHTIRIINSILTIHTTHIKVGKLKRRGREMNYMLNHGGYYRNHHGGGGT